MSITTDRTPTYLFGTPTSPASVAGGSSISGTMSYTTPGGVTCGNVMIAVIIGTTAPTSPIAVSCSVCNDGTSYTVDPAGSYTITTPVASETYTFRYDPPDSCFGVSVSLVNGATNAIEAYAVGSTLAVS